MDKTKKTIKQVKGVNRSVQKQAIKERGASEIVPSGKVFQDKRRKGARGPVKEDD